MYSPVHATAGFFIARAIPNPALGLLAAVASHYVLDTIPHGDNRVAPWMTQPGAGHRIFIVELFDLGSAALMIGYLVVTHHDRPWWYLTLGAIAGMLPDMLWGLRYLAGQLSFRLPVIMAALEAHARWHAKIHVKATHDVPFRVGLVYQAALLGLVLGLRL